MCFRNAQERTERLRQAIAHGKTPVRDWLQISLDNNPTQAKIKLEWATSYLVVPLAGYRVHVLGASPSGMSTYAWNTIKAFWTLYFQAAGAELVSYSAEARGEDSRQSAVRSSRLGHDRRMLTDVDSRVYYA
jgi:hypothetical protein